MDGMVDLRYKHKIVAPEVEDTIEERNEFNWINYKIGWKW